MTETARQKAETCVYGNGTGATTKGKDSILQKVRSITIKSSSPARLGHAALSILFQPVKAVAGERLGVGVVILLAFRVSGTLDDAL